MTDPANIKDLKPEDVASTIAKEELLDVDNGLYIVHSASVKYVSLLLAQDESDVDVEVLVVASWLHNIGNAQDKDAHEVISCAKAKSLFANTSADFYYKVCDCIINHRCSKRPETKEGEILRDADKIAFLHSTYLDFVKAEFDREDKSSEFADFVRAKMKFKDAVTLPKGKELFNTYSEDAKQFLS